MITNKKFLYLGIPLSLFSGIILILDLIYSSLSEEIVILFMLAATLGFFLCYKSGAFTQQ